MIKPKLMSNRKRVSLFVMVVIYIVAGLNHFIHPAFYTVIMPPYIPWHLPLVYISGVFEIILALALIPQTTRRYAAWGIIALLIAIFPANVYMLQKYHAQQHPQLWLMILRLPLQLVLIWWAYSFTKKPPLTKKR